MDEFENLSQEDAFRKRLLSRTRYNMHVKYFDEGSNAALIIPVVTKFSPEKKVTPYRNLKCKKAECIYDIEELVDRFRNSMYSNYLNFVCFYCRTTIDINEFYLDKSLASVIEQVHNDYNKSKIVCKSIKAFKNGSWEPMISEYLKQLDSHMNRDLDQGRSRHDKKEREIAMLEKLSGSTLNLTSFSNDGNRGPVFPIITLYSESELKTLEEKFCAGLAQTDILTSHFNIAIKKGEFNQMTDEVSISFGMMGFFLKYLKKFQEEQREDFEFINTKFLLIMIRFFDKFYKKVNFLYRKGLDAAAANNNQSSTSEKENERIALVAYFESHWFLLLCDVPRKVGYMVEFLSEDVLFLKKADMENMCKSFMETELQIYLLRIVWVPGIKLSYMNDCGVYILYYLYKSMTNPDLLTIKVKVKEKELFKKQMQWILLKYAKNDRNRGKSSGGAQKITETNVRSSDSKKSDLWPEPKDIWKMKEEDFVSGEIDTSNILPKDILNDKPASKKISAKEHLPIIDMKKIVSDSNLTLEEKYNKPHNKISKKGVDPVMEQEEKANYLMRPKSIALKSGETFINNEKNNLDSKKSLLVASPDRLSSLKTPGLRSSLNTPAHKSMLAPSKSILTPASALKFREGRSSSSRHGELSTKRSVYIPKLNLQQNEDYIEEKSFLQLEQNQLYNILNDFKEKLAERARMKLLIQKAEEEDGDGNVILVDEDNDEIVMGKKQLKSLLKNKEELMKLNSQAMMGPMLQNNIYQQGQPPPYGMPPFYYPYPPDDYSFSEGDDDDDDDEEEDSYRLDSPTENEKPRKRKKKKTKSLPDNSMELEEKDPGKAKGKGGKKKGKKKKKKKKKEST